MKPRIAARKSALASAFTLIELVLVMAIIAILLGGSIYVMNSSGFFESAQDTVINGDLKTIANALTAYEASSGRPPTTEQGLEALVEKPTKPPIPDRWHQFMEEVPKDPWRQPYRYRAPATKSKKSYDIWTIGKDGQDNTEDDVGNWKKEEKK